MRIYEFKQHYFCLIAERVFGNSVFKWVPYSIGSSPPISQQLMCECCAMQGGRFTYILLGYS